MCLAEYDVYAIFLALGEDENKMSDFLVKDYVFRTAANWLRYAGEAIFRDAQSNTEVFNTKGALYPGPSSELDVKRWNFWIERMKTLVGSGDREAVDRFRPRSDLFTPRGAELNILYIMEAAVVKAEQKGEQDIIKKPQLVDALNYNGISEWPVRFP